jgi:hypothetical protein
MKKDFSRKLKKLQDKYPCLFGIYPKKNIKREVVGAVNDALQKH